MLHFVHHHQQVTIINNIASLIISLTPHQTDFTFHGLSAVFTLTPAPDNLAKIFTESSMKKKEGGIPRSPHCYSPPMINAPGPL